mmetsp:Transcript_1185/g.2685  ORF Transcript_1185/g.2685 Transcript_1185/m.2685 type:complete len:82 (-) Transcript_1185:1594-1839(-)
MGWPCENRAEENGWMFSSVPNRESNDHHTEDCVWVSRVMGDEKRDPMKIVHYFLVSDAAQKGSKRIESHRSLPRQFLRTNH